MDFGIGELGNDDDVCIISKYVVANKHIKVYIEHGRTCLLTYFMSPNDSSHMIIRELDESKEIPFFEGLQVEYDNEMVVEESD